VRANLGSFLWGKGMNCEFLKGHFGGRFEVLGSFCKWNWGVRGKLWHI